MFFKNITNFFKQHLDLIFISLMGVFSFWLMFSTFGYQDGYFVIDSKLYSDFGAHLPLIRSFSFGDNFPRPEYPFYHGEPIRYHYLFYLLVGWLERLGVNLAFALNFLSSLGFWLLLVMIYKLARLFFKKSLAGILAVVLFLFNGSFSWVEYFNRHGLSLTSLLEIPKQTQFASFGPWSGQLVSAFWSLNIYTNQRHLGLSHGLMLWLVYLVAKTLPWHKGGLTISLVQKSRFKLKLTPLPLCLQLAVVLTLGLFPLLHQAAYVMFGIFFISWVAIYSRYYLRQKRLTIKYFLPFGVGGVLSLFTFYFFTNGSGQEIVRAVGYLSPDKTGLGLVRYWWYNLGLYLLIWPVLLFWFLKKKNVFLAIFSFYFLVANLARLSPDMINNHKLVNMFVIGLNTFVAGGIVLIKNFRLKVKNCNKKCSLAIDKIKNLMLAVVVFFLMAGGLVDIWPILNDQTGKLPDYPRSPVMRLVLKRTEPNAQVLSNIYFYNPASLVGRQLYLDYGYFSWSMGYNDTQKRADLRLLFSPKLDRLTWCRLVKKHGIDYVLLDPRLAPIESGRIKVRQSWLVREVRPDFTSTDGWQLWRVEKICGNFNFKDQ